MRLPLSTLIPLARLTLALPLLSPLLTHAEPVSTEPSEKTPPEKKEYIHNLGEMKRMGKPYVFLINTFIAGAKHEDIPLYLEKTELLLKHTLRSKRATPKKATKLEGIEAQEFITTYQIAMQQLTDEIILLKKALQEENLEKANHSLQKIRQMKSDGHKFFKYRRN